MEESGAIDSSLRHQKVSRPRLVQTSVLERNFEVVYDYAVSRHTLNEHSHKHPPWRGSYVSTDEQSMNRSISLSVDESLAKQNPDSKLLLKVLSLLPGRTKDNLLEAP